MSESHRVPNLWVGLDVHKESVTAAVFRNRDPDLLRVDRLPNDLKKIRRYFERLQVDGPARACYERASGAGYIPQHSHRLRRRVSSRRTLADPAPAG